ncbi:MAG: hypothetical protein M3441_09230 [Chloroflexota bacterium]|nr:hypothetical protein [Chloroflexota bacterium]MDQ5824375.1 hypothetical protein [Chloroflexota bacterium]MDQ5866982.1 hypothetical protein [Chloroflexota bacterium]
MLQAQSNQMPSIADLLVRGKQAAMSGQRELARETLAHVVYLDPGNAEGWLWLSGVVDQPEQVRYCLERTLRIEPHNARALRGIEWLDSRQKEIDEARAAAERVKPYWQTSKPKPLLNLIKGQSGAASVGTAVPLPRSGEQSQQPASWTSVAANIPNTRVARANMPTAPVSGETLDRLQRNPQAAPVNDRQYREEVLETDDELAPRFVTNIALHNLMKAVDKVTGASGLAAMLRMAELEELEGLDLEPDETPAINYTRFSAFSEAMEEFYTHAVDSMEYKVGREMFRQELAMKGKMVAMKGITFKLMSPDKKLRTILMELADAHARMGMEAYFEEREGGYLFGIETCPYCYGRLTNAHCNVTTGFLAAGIEWATGRALELQEVSCRGLDEEFCGYWIPV